MFDREALTGKFALVTGGAGGIGSACAEALARDGATVTLMGRTEASLREAAQRIAEAVAPERVRYHVGDARTETDVAAAVEAASDAGRLDVCVTTVGGGLIAPLLLFDADTFTNELSRNTTSAFIAIKHSVPNMRASGGAIVCVSSDASRLSWPLMAGYCAGKAGLDALVRVAADELGDLGIRVNAVRPGLTRTRSNNSSLLFSDEELISEFRRQKPLGRTGTPEDVAAGVRYLAGPEASWVTGHSLAIEGGNELRRAPSLEKVARLRYGDEAVDAAMRGARLPAGS